jgi:hypothetical protein
MADETPETTPAFDPTTLDDAALHAAYATAKERGAELAAKAELSTEEDAELASLAERSQALVGELSARKAKAEQTQANRDAFASLPEFEAPKAPEPVQAPVSAPVTETPAPAPVAVPSVSEMAVQPPVIPTQVAKAGEVSTTTHLDPSFSHILGLKAGDSFTGNDQIAFALIKDAQSRGRAGGGGTKTVAQFKRNRGAELTIEDGNDRDAVKKALTFARNERRLNGGSLAKAWQRSIDEGASLTAAAGWCAPSQNDYDLCTSWSSPVGLLDLPTVTVTRGGINYTDEPTFQQIYANAIAAGGGSNFLTEAQVIADTLKTCSEIPCPTFEDRRLDVMALCIRVSFLQAAGYPEVVAAWDDGLRAAHEAEMNRIIIADIIARAGAATVIDGFGADDDSFTSGLLAAVELAAEDTRYLYHMDWNQTIEVALPHWVIPQIRADLSRRTGDTGNLLAVTDSQIASLFSARGVRVHWVRGWQDGLITGGAPNPAFPGGDITAPYSMVALPQTGIQFLSWPAGSIAVARQDVVTLTNVYDSAGLAVNEFTALFAEEGFAPIYPCPGQRLYTVNDLCVGGITGAADIHCSLPAAA